MKYLYNKAKTLFSQFRVCHGTNVFWSFLSGIVKISLPVIALLLILILFKSLVGGAGPIQDGISSKEVEAGVSDHRNCSVQGIKLRGGIVSYIPSGNDSSSDSDSVASEDIVAAIKQANDDPEIKAILVEVNSHGGEAVSGEEISDVIRKSKKPVVSVIRDIGASAAYLAISASERIFASKYSRVGGIGVTLSYQHAASNNQNGLVYEQLSMGKFKDYRDPEKILIGEERALIMRDVNIAYNNFISDVSRNRKLPLEQVKALADGSTVLGERAKEAGLIDEVGSFDQAKAYLSDKMGEQGDICW